MQSTNVRIAGSPVCHSFLALVHRCVAQTALPQVVVIRTLLPPLFEFSSNSRKRNNEVHYCGTMRTATCPPSPFQGALETFQDRGLLRPPPPHQEAAVLNSGHYLRAVGTICRRSAAKYQPQGASHRPIRSQPTTGALGDAEGTDATQIDNERRLHPHTKQTRTRHRPPMIHITPSILCPSAGGLIPVQYTLRCRRSYQHKLAQIDQLSKQKFTPGSSGHPRKPDRMQTDRHPCQHIRHDGYSWSAPRHRRTPFASWQGVFKWGGGGSLCTKNGPTRCSQL